MTAVAITRTELGSADLREQARRAERPEVVRRLLALAQVLDGIDRETAAKNAGMDRQTLRDWVHRYNAEGVAGLSSRKATGRKPALTAAQKLAFKQIVETGPDLAIDKVVRWRCADLKRVLEERFEVAVHERTIGKFLHALNYRRLSVRPKHPKSDPEAQEIFKKISRSSPPRPSPKRPNPSRSKSGSRTRPASDSKAR